MALTLAQLSSHEITALLGRGGRGEVYRARDLKLNDGFINAVADK
jgi:hypothetical protein